jgi:hypothetical protein
MRIMIPPAESEREGSKFGKGKFGGRKEEFQPMARGYANQLVGVGMTLGREPQPDVGTRRDLPQKRRRSINHNLLTRIESPPPTRA